MTGFANAVETALYSKLTGSTALTALLSGGTASPSVYRYPGPEAITAPYVIFQPQSPSRPVRTMGAVVAYENSLYTVKAVVESPSAALAGSIAQQIEIALDGPSLTYTGYTHVRCTREQDIDYPELAPGGQVIQHRGAVYRVQAF